MNVIRLCGGLGNQLFQYAFGLACSHETLYDVSWFARPHHKETPRRYELAQLNCTVPTPQSVRSLGLGVYHVRDGNGYSRWLRKFKEASPVRFDPTLCRLDGKYLTGYFQSEKYFASCRKQILSAFTSRAPLSPDSDALRREIAQANSVSIHVRRGDYLTHQHVYSLCGPDYYTRAIEDIASRMRNPVFFIFSDDMDWCRNNLKIRFDHTFIDHTDRDNPICDLMLMKSCRHNIIANSSYSWWGAWLNENPTKTVIAPQNWFADGRQTDTIPHSWIKL